MEQTAVAQPCASSGEGYSIWYQSFLHVAAAILRKSVSRLTGPELPHQKKLTIDTPLVGGGSVSFSVWLPAGNLQPGELHPLVLVLEGGGFVLGQPKDGQQNSRRISDETGAIVISVEYAKAPRYPYPHALLQLYQVLQWSFSAAAKAEGLDIDPSRVAFLGNSAGGNLAASLSLLLSFTEGPCAKFREALPSNFRERIQILLYPSLELYNSYSTRLRRVSKDIQAKSLPLWIAELMEASYCPPYIDKAQIFVSPLSIDNELLKTLKVPPALVLTAGLDCLKEEATQYVKKLKEAGVDVQTKEYALAVHGFSHFTETSIQKEDYRPDDVYDCWKLVIEALKNYFADTKT